MTTPSSPLPDKLFRLALMLLAVAVMLNIAARLILAVLLVLIGLAIVGLIGFLAWSLYQFGRSKW